MANSKQQENLLLTEHFTWPPISLLDDIINAINEVLYRCTDTFETGLLSADPALLGFTANADEDEEKVRERARLEIEEGVLKLETLMEGAVDRNFDRLEIWALRNVLCLPREEEVEGWVRLGHYENLAIPSKDNHLTPEALHTLRRTLAETNKLHAVLLAEKTRNEAQLARLRALLQPSVAPKREPRASASPAAKNASNGNNNSSAAAPFAFLSHAPAAQSLGIQSLPAPAFSTAPESRTPLTTHTTFTTSQLPYLRQLLAQLKPHVGSAALPGGQGEAWARERRVYVESQSRRVLEKRGVDTRDGVGGSFEGQRVRGEEVGALEGIVGAMGGRKGGREAGDGDGDRDGGEGEAMDTSA